MSLLRLIVTLDMFNFVTYLDLLLVMIIYNEEGEHCLIISFPSIHS